jgi:hypothetical protein
MSHGPGAVERKIGDLFASVRYHAIGVDEIAARAFDLPKGAKPTRAERNSAIRAAHRLIRRLAEMEARASKFVGKAWRRVDEALPKTDTNDDARSDMMRATREWRQAERLRHELDRIGSLTRFFRKPGDRDRLYAERETWRATLIGKGRAARLLFHLPDVPVQVFAVTIDRNGVHWFEAEIIRITARNVVMRYGGAVARLDRFKLWRHWAWWRGVMFVSSRSGRIAARLDQIWRNHFFKGGAVPPALKMPLAEAIAILGVPSDYTRADVIAAFRRKAKACHPDLGGSAEAFQKLVEARDRLLAALGIVEPAPPAYYPSGTRVIYRSGRSGHARLAASGVRRLAR